MNEFDPNNLPPEASFLNGPDPEFDASHYDQAKGGLITNHNGMADRLLKNDKLYNSLKGNWKRTDWSNNGNMRITTGREDGKFYIQREQMNVQEVVKRVREYRAAAEAGWADAMAPIMPDGKLGYRWIDLPKVIERQIVDDYFGGMPWAVIKRDRTLKAQFYKVVEKEYPAFVCYPHGKLPIPIEVPYPNKVGQEKFFRGISQ